MAIARTAATTWVALPTEYNISDSDAVISSTGQVVFALGGITSGMDGQILTATLDLATQRLGAFSATIYPQLAGGLPFTSASPIDLVAGPGGRISATLRMPEYGGNGDANAGLLVQRFDGAAALGAAVAVDPANLARNVGLESALVFRADGTSAVFYTEQGTGASDGIRMARFDATGAAAGAPLTAIADHPAGGSVPIEANPVMVDATLMKNGNYGVTWTESSPFQSPTFGQPRVMFQEVSAAGVAQGTALVIDATSAQKSQILTLASGKMVVVWLDAAVLSPATWKGQMLDASGAVLGGVFDISSSLSTQETDLDLVAAGSGFAASWRDGNTGAILGRMFNGQGGALGNDFALVETAGTLIGPKAGLLAQGDTLYAWVTGLPGGGTGTTVLGQSWVIGSSWGLRDRGTALGEAMTGAARDDVLSGLGGADTLTGGAGGDILDGGAGRDRILGGTGIDLITGGLGADRLSGGSGGDSFVFLSAAEGGDTILDFNGAEGDRIVLSSAGFGGFRAVGVGNGAQTGAGLWFDRTTGDLTYDPDGSGAAPQVRIAHLAGVTDLAYDDWLVVA